MKKKKLTGKLSLQKSKISALDGSKIKGGGSFLQTCYPDCMTFPVLCGPGTTYGIDCDPTYTLTENGGSECECL